MHSFSHLGTMPPHVPQKEDNGLSSYKVKAKSMKYRLG